MGSEEGVRRVHKGRTARRRPLWLIVKHHNDRMAVLTVSAGGDSEALPVFSFEEEAEMFLQFGVSKTGWQVRETTAGELVSVLYGPCAGVEKVALDPPPEIVGKAMVGLMSLSRKDFARTLVSEFTPSGP